MTSSGKLIEPLLPPWLVPVVYAYAPSEDPADLSLVTDNVAGGRMAVDHLIRHGRRLIAHITGDPSYGAAQDRARGALDRLAEDGLPLAGDQVWFGAWSEARGRDATRMLSCTRSTGCPRQGAVIGFDNWTSSPSTPARL